MAKKQKQDVVSIESIQEQKNIASAEHNKKLAMKLKREKRELPDKVLVSLEALEKKYKLKKKVK